MISILHDAQHCAHYFSFLCILYVTMDDCSRPALDCYPQIAGPILSPVLTHQVSYAIY